MCSVVGSLLDSVFSSPAGTNRQAARPAPDANRGPLIDPGMGQHLNENAAGMGNIATLVEPTDANIEKLMVCCNNIINSGVL